MGLISEIRKKSKIIDKPDLTISKNDQDRLRRGEIVIMENDRGDAYIIRIDDDKIGSGSISKDDLKIEKIKSPVAAFPRETHP